MIHAIEFSDLNMPKICRARPPVAAERDHDGGTLRGKAY